MKCSKCEFEVNEQWNYCPNCKNNVSGLEYNMFVEKEYFNDDCHCSNCSEEIEKDWKYCPNCAALLKKKKENICPYCGYENKFYVSSCANCDNDLNTDERKSIFAIFVRLFSGLISLFLSPKSIFSSNNFGLTFFICLIILPFWAVISFIIALIGCFFYKIYYIYKDSKKMKK